MTSDDEVAFAAFYRARVGWAMRRGEIILGDTLAAEEIAQDVFLQAMRTWTTLDNPEAWLTTVLSRRLAREASKQNARRLMLGKLAASGRARVDDPEAYADLREDYRRVRAAMDRLPGQQRVVIALRLLDELTEAETATALGIAASTANKHFTRALAKLHQEFGRHGERLLPPAETFIRLAEPRRLPQEGGTL
ncbi:RNA polymerase sigma factor [Frankia sp. AgKG'84/4]|uniref:RNA polymerase sigma factor n=1 Tax=Frankia sp. AgKG'84/4 TaxID=573490 RepID=UPI00200D0C68|nr:sigma-70 family RNA polymerase sigma factor [Frankia sp. AgKG'84/4]MCL9795492.1 sigma-70 family RNA polymerase sigma factor [Frankia sp. AgKG'84/4]